jgi:hypothetical protein
VAQTNPFLDTIERRENAEGKGILIRRMEEHRQEHIRPLQDELNGRQRPRTDQTPMDHGHRNVASFRKGCPKIVPQGPKDSDVVMFRQPKKGFRVHHFQSIVGKDLTEERPSHPHAILEARWFCRDTLAMPTPNRPHLPQASLRVHGQGNFGVGVRGLHRQLGPLPECRKIKPPGLPVLREGKVVQGRLPICGLAGLQVFIVGEIRPPKNSRSSKGKPMANPPSAHDGLNPLRCIHFSSVGLYPQCDRFTSRMRPAECVAE